MVSESLEEDVNKVCDMLMYYRRKDKTPVDPSVFLDSFKSWGTQHTKLCMRKMVELYEHVERTDEGFVIRDGEKGGFDFEVVDRTFIAYCYAGKVRVPFTELGPFIDESSYKESRGDKGYCYACPEDDPSKLKTIRIRSGTIWRICEDCKTDLQEKARSVVEENVGSIVAQNL